MIDSRTDGRRCGRGGHRAASWVFALLLLQACTGETVTEVSVSEVEVFPPSVSAVVGESVRLDAVVRDELGEELSRATPLWSSDDPLVAEVDASGLVHARSGGRTQVTATYEGVSGTSIVRVFEGPGIGASDEDVELLSAAGRGTPDPEVVFITNAGTGTLEGLEVEARHPGEPRWLTVTLEDAAAPTSLTLRADADGLAGGLYEATAVVSSSTPDVEPLEIRVRLRIADVRVQHSGGATVVSESATTDSLTVSLGSAPTENVVLEISSADRTEATVTPTRLTFTPQSWSTEQRITVTGVEDSVADGDQRSDVRISVDRGASDRAYDLVADIVISVTTVDDDEAGLLLTESEGSTVVAESGETDQFAVALTAAPRTDVVLDVTSEDPLEATVSPSRLTFTPGNWSVGQPVTVTGVDDATNDGDQVTVVRVSVNAAASDEAFDAVSDGTVSVTTTDDDEGGVLLSETGGSTVVTEAGAADQIDVVLSAQPADNVVLSVSSADPGEVTVSPTELTFTPGNWNLVQSVTVTGVDDSEVDGDQSTVVTVSVVAERSDDAYDVAADGSVTVTTTDDDAAGLTLSETGGSTVVTEGGGTDELSVALTAAPASVVVVDVTSGDALEATVSPSRLTFGPGDWNVAQTVTVTGVDDSEIDGDQVTQVTAAIDASASDDAFDGAAARSVSVTTRDDDLGGISLSETGGSSVVTEQGGTDEIEVSLTAAPSSSVVVDVTSEDTLEVTVSPGRLTFTAGDWSLAQVVTLTGVDDTAVDGDRVTTVTAAVDPAASDDGFDGAAPETVRVTTIDDDVAGLSVTETDDSTVVGEDGSSDAILVALTAAPLSPVELAVSSSDPSEFLASPATLTFTTTSWADNQVVTLEGVDDAEADGPQESTFTVSVVASRSDDTYDSVPPKTVSVTTVDNEAADDDDDDNEE